MRLEPDPNNLEIGRQGVRPFTHGSRLLEDVDIGEPPSDFVSVAVDLCSVTRLTREAEDDR
jgi:hypothetical protein